jgi:membrane protease YdiL (CAAX protease family)
VNVPPTSPDLPDCVVPRDRGALTPVVRCVLYIVCWTAAAATLLYVASSIMGPAAHRFRFDQGGSALVGVSLECAAGVGVALVFGRFLDRRPLATLGLTFRIRWLRLFGIGVLVGLGMQSVVLALESVLGYTHTIPAQWSSAELGSFAYVIPVLLLGAVSEEMPVRGYLFQNLRDAWGTWPSLIVTSLLFAALHFFNPSAHADFIMTMTGVAVAGALFCFSVVLTGSLWFAVGCHFAWNLFEGPVFGFPVSGLTIGSAHIFLQTVRGPEWFTGGSFGPEAGASSLIALACGAALLWVLHRRGAFAA